jgi:hypothetical protein
MPLSALFVVVVVVVVVVDLAVVDFSNDGRGVMTDDDFDTFVLYTKRQTTIECLRFEWQICQVKTSRLPMMSAINHSWHLALDVLHQQHQQHHHQQKLHSHVFSCLKSESIQLFSIVVVSQLQHQPTLLHTETKQTHVNNRAYNANYKIHI